MAPKRPDFSQNSNLIKYVTVVFCFYGAVQCLLAGYRFQQRRRIYSEGNLSFYTPWDAPVKVCASLALSLQKGSRQSCLSISIMKDSWSPRRRCRLKAERQDGAAINPASPFIASENRPRGRK